MWANAAICQVAINYTLPQRVLQLCRYILHESCNEQWCILVVHFCGMVNLMRSQTWSHVYGWVTTQTMGSHNTMSLRTVTREF